MSQVLPTPQEVEKITKALPNRDLWQESLDPAQLRAIFKSESFRQRKDYPELLNNLSCYLYIGSKEVDFSHDKVNEEWVALWWEVVRGELGATVASNWNAFDAYVDGDLHEHIGDLGEVNFQIIELFSFANSRLRSTVDSFKKMSVPKEVKERGMSRLTSQDLLNSLEFHLDNATGALVLALAWLDPSYAREVLARLPLVESPRSLLCLEEITSDENREVLAELLTERATFQVHSTITADYMTVYEFGKFASLTNMFNFAPALCFPEEFARYCDTLPEGKIRELAQQTDQSIKDALWHAPYSNGSAMIPALITHSPGLAAHAMVHKSFVSDTLQRSVESFMRDSLPSPLARETAKKLAYGFPGSVADLVEVTKACLV